MSTYVNNLRLEEIGTGERSGTWGTATNTNLELIGEALGFGTEAITTNADTHASVIADGASDGGSGNDVFEFTKGNGFDKIRDFIKGEDRVDINQLGVFDSGKNLKVYLDKEKSDLLAIVYGYNLSDVELSDIIY